MRLQQVFRLLLSLLILITLLINASGLYHYPFLQKLENWTYDSRLNFTLPDTLDKEIVIVDIDEISISKVGRFPWKRDVMATLVTNLFEQYKIKTLGFDILFAEEDTSSGLEAFLELADTELKNDQLFLSALEEIRPSLQYDQLFAQSLLNKDIVLGYYFRGFVKTGEETEIGKLPLAIAQMTDEWAQRLPIYKAEAYSGNLPILQNASRSGGYFDNPSVDADGVFRRVPLVQSYNGLLYSSLALSTARLALGNPKIELMVETDGKKNGQEYFALETINLGQFRIPVDSTGAVYVPYRGQQGSFKYVSAFKVLNKTADPESLRNKIILLGTSAPGLLDLRSTPVQNIYPGVEVHANIVSGILNQTIKHKPAWAVGYEFLLLILLAITMYLILAYLSPILAALSTLIMTFIVISGTMLAWDSLLILPLASPLLLIALMFTLHMTYGFFIESRGKRQLAHMFGQYIPPELVDEMSETATEFSLEGESREMTVLFSDV
ncbi:MAG: CHASE2 domain-containing protein, partial [Gammaproteobacteria bacterium]|nr:CHASE2 domain-containing protein [Gammaproteobacteria bacterium]